MNERHCNNDALSRLLERLLLDIKLQIDKDMSRNCHKYDSNISPDADNLLQGCSPYS